MPRFHEFQLAIGAYRYGDDSTNGDPITIRLDRIESYRPDTATSTKLYMMSGDVNVIFMTYLDFRNLMRTQEGRL